MKTATALESDTSVFTMRKEIDGYEVTLTFPATPEEDDASTLNGVLNALINEYRRALHP